MRSADKLNVSAEQTSDTVPFIIDGKDVISSSTFKVINPATGERVWDASSVSNGEAIDAIKAAEAAFPSWSQTKPSYRRDIMFRAADLFLSRKQELLSYQNKETGAGVQFMEININATAQILRDIGGRIEAAVQGFVPVTAEEDSHAMIVKEPYGVVLAIAPWYASYIFSLSPGECGETEVVTGMLLTCWVPGRLHSPSRQATQRYSKVPNSAPAYFGPSATYSDKLGSQMDV